jgi:hypothetical protein
VLSRRFIAYMQQVDRYHLAKIHTRRRPLDFSDEERAAVNRKGVILTMHGWVRRPYRAIRHVVLRNFLTVETLPSAASSTVPAPHMFGVNPSKGSRVRLGLRKMVGRGKRTA